MMSIWGTEGLTIAARAMQLAVVAALTPNNKPLVLHIKLQNPRSASTYKSLRITVDTGISYIPDWG